VVVRGAWSCVWQLYEPIELEQSHYTDFDQEVRVTDMPERFQLRTVPICPTEEGELDEEAEWIYRHAFSTPPVSRYCPVVLGILSASLQTKLQFAICPFASSVIVFKAVLDHVARTMYVDAVYCYRPSSVVCWSDALSH